MGTGYLDQLKQEAFEVNMGIVRERLVVLTWGNASSFDRAHGIFAIKPSGVSYSLLKWQDMVLVDLEGNVIDSKLKPSSDTLTHLEIYKGFSTVCGIVHTHSPWATIWGVNLISRYLPWYFTCRTYLWQCTLCGAINIMACHTRL